MPGSSSTMGSRSTYRCDILELSDVDTETLASAERRAQEQHERRLARIVADQWMHVARKRLTLAWCAQMMSCWRKICSESVWSRRQKYLAYEHHTRRTFNAFREGSRRSHSTAAAFYKGRLERKALFSLSKAQFKNRRHHDHQYLSKAFLAVKQNHEKKRATRRMSGGAESFHDSSLKKKALRGLSKHREHLKLKSFRQTAASYHWKKHMKARILHCWRMIAKRISDLRSKGENSRILLLQALLKRCMKSWLLVTTETAHARQEKVARYRTSRKRRTLRAWAQRSTEKQSRRLKLEQAAAMWSERTAAAVTRAWRNYAEQKEVSRARNSTAFSFRRKQALSDAVEVWKAYQARKEKAGNAALKALAHLKRNLTQKSMDAWKPRHENRTSVQANLVTRKQDREKAPNIYKYRLQRWAFERILAVGLMLQALRLQSKEGGPSDSSYLKVAPYARKWCLVAQRRRNLREALNLQCKEEGSQTQNECVPHKEPFMHEILLRIGIDKDGQTLKIQHERPASPLVEMTNAPHERPQPRGRSFLPPPPIPAQPSGIPPSQVVRQRPAPRRPAFLSFPIS